ncbi:Sialidase precursor [Planctomycetes bacterium Pla163]|uniref:exo-alpha-sialidase n=1 Tax=Rohdeia mirabilis TaxID=2528008 RepID=A0A518CV36_9BACT|nr:Sialidase precursor [Planctomycetes bacterium Pla163]
MDADSTTSLGRLLARFAVWGAILLGTTAGFAGVDDARGAGPLGSAGAQDDEAGDDLFDSRGEPRLDAERLVAWYRPSMQVASSGDSWEAYDYSEHGRHGQSFSLGRFTVDEDAFGAIDGPCTVVCAARVDAGDGGYLFDGAVDGGRRALFAGWSQAPARFTTYGGAARSGAPVRGGTWQVHTVVFGREHTTHYVDGVARSVGAAPTEPLRGLTVGQRYDGSLALNGAIAHLVLYRGELSRDERRGIERWLAAQCGSDGIEAAPFPARPVFTAGDGLYHTYRIPAASVTASGAVLCFAEGRASRSDHAANDLVLRRSPDGGRTWEPVRTLFSDGANALNNPCVVALHTGEHAGRVLLVWQRYLEGHDEHGAAAGYDDPKVCRSYVAHSDDEGLTWSEPREITRAVKPPAATSTASGPGAALQLRDGPHAGRIVVPFNCGPFGEWRVYAAWSDDGGATWERGDFGDDTGIAGRGNEVQMVELPGGALLLNARVQGGGRRRVQARSTDGGATWSPLEVAANLVEPQCMASVLALPGGPHGARLVYCGPRSERARVAGTLMLSDDQGRSWQLGPCVYDGGFAYSQLVRLDADTLGVLFERDGYRGIDLVRVPIAALPSPPRAISLHPPPPRGRNQRGDGAAPPAPPFPELPRGPGLAAEFPLDAGIDEHERVLFAERFDGSTLDEVLARWTDHTQDSSVFELVRGGPLDGGDGARVLRVTATPSENTGGHLYRVVPGVERMYARFCVRYPSDALGYQHHGVHLGGYEPSTPWPQGGAGSRPAGDDRITVGIEPFAHDGRMAAPGAWSFYCYWHEMKISADGNHWGNGIEPSERLQIPANRWQTVEVMVQLNTPGERDGELALWLDGEPVMHVRAGTPRAHWSGLGFDVLDEGDPEAEPFEGFSWRTSAELELNFFQLLHYVTPRALRRAGVTDVEAPVAVEFDHVVVAEDYVGPVAARSTSER